MDTVTIQLDSEAARIYQMAPAEEQKKLQLLVSLCLREFSASTISLDTLMDEISEKTRERGLTPEILESLLHDS